MRGGGHQSAAGSKAHLFVMGILMSPWLIGECQGWEPVLNTCTVLFVKPTTRLIASTLIAVHPLGELHWATAAASDGLQGGIVVIVPGLLLPHHLLCCAYTPCEVTHAVFFDGGGWLEPVCCCCLHLVGCRYYKPETKGLDFEGLMEDIKVGGGVGCALGQGANMLKWMLVHLSLHVHTVLRLC